MKTLLSVFFLTALVSCTSPGSEPGEQPHKSSHKSGDEESQADKGNLYLWSFQFSGVRGKEYAWYYLSDDGVLVKNPKHGVDPLSIELEKEDNADNTATYKIKGDEIEVHWDNGQKTTWGLEYKGDVITGMDSGPMSQPKAFDDGFTLHAKYYAALVLQDAKAGKYLALKDDGSAVLSNEDGTDASQGKYNIKGHTLTITIDGNVQKAIIGYLAEEGKKSVIINDHFMDTVLD